jgi:hypothetical protein
MSTGLPLSEKAVLRPMIASAETLDRSVMMSSLMPSEKYSCSASPLMLTNGSTQMTTRRAGSRLGAGSAAGLMAPASELMLLTTLCQPGQDVSPVPANRSAHWIWLNGIGGNTPSRLTLHQGAEFARRIRFGPNPLRLDRIVRPQHQHGLGRLDPFLDHVAVGAVGWQLVVAPHLVSGRPERICRLPRERLVRPGVGV